MENDNILDNNPGTYTDSEEDIDNSIFRIAELVDSISSGGVDAVRYPIGDTMYKDMQYHSRQYPIVSLHICAYQRQDDMRKRPFVQYLLRLEDSTLGFYNKPFFNAQDGDLYMESTKMLKILMAHYRKFLTNDDMFEYTGFHKDGNDFYVFFDVTKTWIAYHLLGMKDPFWTVMPHEIIGNGTVCGFPINSVTHDLFVAHPDLVHLIDRKDNPYVLPRTGYSLECIKDLDRVLMIGMIASPLPALGGDYFQFMWSYADCVRGRTAAELKDKIVVRYCLMCDDPIDPPDDMVYEGDLEGHEGTSYHATDANGRRILAVKSFYAQTSITAYNAIVEPVTTELDMAAEPKTYEPKLQQEESVESV